METLNEITVQTCLPILGVWIADIELYFLGRVVLPLLVLPLLTGALILTLKPCLLMKSKGVAPTRREKYQAFVRTLGISTRLRGYMFISLPIVVFSLTYFLAKPVGRLLGTSLVVGALISFIFTLWIFLLVTLHFEALFHSKPSGNPNYDPTEE